MEAVITLCLALLAAAVTPIEVSLKPFDLTDPFEALSASMGGLADELIDAQPSKDLLAGAQFPLFKAKWQVGATTMDLALEVSESRARALWLDTNRNGSLEPTERHVGRVQSGWSFVGPIELPKENARVLFAYHEDFGLIPAMSRVLMGTLTLGAKSYRIAKVTGFDGPNNWAFVADFDGNGKFGGWTPDGPQPDWLVEGVPASQLLQLPDGKVYRAKFVGEKVVFEAPEAWTKVVSPKPGVMALSRGEQTMWVTTVRGEAQVPTGEWTLDYSNVATSDGKAGDASMMILPATDPVKIELAAAAFPWPGSGPYALSLSVVKEGGALLVKAHLMSGEAGKGYVGPVEPSGVSLPIAEFVDGAGVVVRSLTLQSDMVGSYEAKVPAAESVGASHVRLTWNPGNLKLDSKPVAVPR